MISGIGSFEIMIILAVVLILFGSKQLPQAARTIGKGLRDMQRASQGVQDEIHKVMNEIDQDEQDELKG